MSRPLPRPLLAWPLALLLLILSVLAPSPAAAQAGAGARVVTIRDAETENLIRSFAHPLFASAGIDPGLVRITLIQDRAINAFVSTGNRMFIHTGLIQTSGSAGEFIGVLAHETGHIAGGHLARLPEEMRAAMLRSVAAMLLGGAAAAASGSSGAAAAAILGGQSMAMREFFAFTRAQEQAADQAGVTYLDRNGWSARGMERLLERLLDQEILTTARQDPYMRTHPLSRDRLEFVREHLARSRYTDAPFPPGFEEGFAMVKAKLDGFLDSPANTWRRYPETDTSAPARYARAIALFRSGRIQPAVDVLDGLIREDPGNPWLHEMKGQVLFEGHRPQEALVPYREAVRLAPSEPLIRLSLARVMIELGDPALLRTATGELEAALRSGERESPFVWRQLGIAYGRLGQMPQADLALAEEAMLMGDFVGARTLARRAEAALPPGPLRLRAQDLYNAARPENLSAEDRRREEMRRRGVPR